MDKWLLNSSGGSCLLTIGSGPNMDTPKNVVDAKEAEQEIKRLRQDNDELLKRIDLLKRMINEYRKDNK